ncbi:hypothetical protein GIB67_018938 [Kingdonia uniflora]|uniref:Uncharacterized protein n=1 Tax=Kingdonia uniflora TaxID=39325 RepID=A0A7J7L2U7_9MAGN|nr:hypothetical protein GIB67_018938 [Kingdonia uniflora]
MRILLGFVCPGILVGSPFEYALCILSFLKAFVFDNSLYELLSMVRKYSNLLGKSIVDSEDASDTETNSVFWHKVLDLYFISGKESKGRHDDDLIFFVRKMSLHGYGFNDNIEGTSPYFVRRWASKLENVIGENSADVDWRRSFYLNLIAHTTFTVTVAICCSLISFGRNLAHEIAERDRVNSLDLERGLLNVVDKPEVLPRGSPMLCRAH